MQSARVTLDHEPVILLDPHIDSEVELAMHLELSPCDRPRSGPAF